MAKKRKPLVGTRRTREHVRGDLAVNHAERQASLCGFTVERTRSDYAIDLLLFTFDATGEIEDGYVPIQVKAMERLSWLRRKKAAAFRIERKHLAGWLRQSMPVILAVSDAAADQAVWVHVQAYFTALPCFDLFRADETLTVHLPEAQVLNPDAIRQFAEFRKQASRRSESRRNPC